VQPEIHPDRARRRLPLRGLHPARLSVRSGAVNESLTRFRCSSYAGFMPGLRSPRIIISVSRGRADRGSGREASGPIASPDDLTAASASAPTPVVRVLLSVYCPKRLEALGIHPGPEREGTGAGSWPMPQSA